MTAHVAIPARAGRQICGACLVKYPCLVAHMEVVQFKQIKKRDRRADDASGPYHQEV